MNDKIKTVIINGAKAGYNIPEIVKADKTSLYYIDNKRVTYERFCYKQILCNMENRRVSCSQTTKTSRGNLKHVAFYD